MGTKVIRLTEKDISSLVKKVLEEQIKGQSEKSNLDSEDIQESRKKSGTKLCARGKAAAKAKFKVWPSAYGNGYAVQVCQGRIKGLDGKRHCSGAYC
jgi:hypothetical protein